MSQREEFLKLIDKYISGTASPEEMAALDRYYALFGDEPDHSGRLNEKQIQALEKRMEEGLFKRLQQPGRAKYWPRIAIAASLLIGLSFGGYLWLQKPKPQQTARVQQHDIAPGGNKAILTLAGGQKIVLTGAANGKVAQQGNTLISKTAPGMIQYANNQSSANQPAEYNTLTTPRKGQQTLVLADGTEVMLDAASSITYPVAFNGADRKVSVTGQVYFKVKHDAAHPFSVTYRGLTVEDIGTEFNINAYADEPAIETTLISGSIRVRGGSSARVLKPGEQAVALNGQTALQVKTVDLEGVTAWKNNYFLFDGDNLGSIMRKVSRWYDVDVVYDYPAAQNKQFGGTVSRFKNLSSLLDKLELTGGVHFHIQGNKIIVTK